MADNITAPSRKTLRLTFQVAGGEIQLLRHERLGMITPPSAGPAPEVGKHAGFWVELRDANDRVLFHRVLHLPLGDSVEVYSPDGTIQREFGPTPESTFEVLIPDYDEATSLAFCGEYLNAEAFRAQQADLAAEPPPPSRELARFEIPKEDKGGEK